MPKIYNSKIKEKHFHTLMREDIVIKGMKEDNSI